MSVHLGAGWHLVHCTDRVIEARKSDAVYRRFTGRDGYVKVRGEPGIDRTALIERARQMAQRNDELLSYRVAMQMIPTLAARDGFRIRQRQEARAFGVPGEEPDIRLYRP